MVIAGNCTNCSEKASTYCVDCKRVLCRFCTTLLHHPGTKCEKHSIEEIHLNHRGVKLITPILLDVLLVGVACFLFTSSGITPDYFKGVSYCPALSRGRWWIANVDATIFFYYKESLAKWCDWEDSYWRFYMDTWVRGILTHTDSWLLIISEFLKAYIFEEFARVVISPTVGTIYAIIASFGCILERQVATYIEPENNESHWLCRAERLIQRLSVAENLRIKDKKAPPPPTFLRKRPMTDYVELLHYLRERHTRLLAFYKAQAQAALKVVLQGTLWAAAVLRVACMLLGSRWLLEPLRAVGLGAAAAQHQAWFTEATGVGAEEHPGYVSDWFVALGLRQALKVAPEAAELTGDLGRTLLGGLSTVLLPFLTRFFLPLLVLTLPPLLFRWKLKKQRKEFDRTWKERTRKEIWGEMSRTNPCGGHQWEQVRFSNC